MSVHMPITSSCARLKEAQAGRSSLALMLVYRKDVLSERGLPVPESWDQLAQVASQLQGVDLDGDGEEDYALCFDMAPGGCRLHGNFSSWS